MKIRSFLFNIVFFSATALVLTLGTLALIFPRKACLAVTRFWAGLMLSASKRIIGLDYRVEGWEHLSTPCIIASQHQSTWDTIIFHFLVNDPAYVIKKELNRFTLGWYMKRLKLIVVNRADGGRALLNLLKGGKEAVKAGRSIVIFPEGKRTQPSEHAPLQKGVGVLYKQLQIPVVPLLLDSGKFWGRRSFHKKSGTITLKLLPPILPGLSIDDFMTRLESQWREPI